MKGPSVPVHGRGFVDGAGRQVRLGQELGRGGEGTVYDVVGAPTQVAKVYHHQPDSDKAAKLAAMTRVASPALSTAGAWPMATLHAYAGGPVAGLIMPRARGVEVHRVYSPAYRKAEFPGYDWEKLIFIARNIAAAVSHIHHAGHVVGDMNEGNVLVAPNGIVQLIDCDSFQIDDAGEWRLCEVGVANFTPPELQSASFRGVVRTPNHDAFGLAVLIFHLLFMGRHPYAGRFGGTGNMPLEQAIREHRFAFGRNAGSVLMAPPPDSLPLVSASESLAAMFERAFGEAGSRPGARPSAKAWALALDGLRAELATCNVNRAHRFHRSLGTACPWCAIEATGGPNFFVSVVAAVQATAGGFDLHGVWASIIAQTAPERDPPFPAPVVGALTPSAKVTWWRRLAWRTQKWLMRASVAGGVVAWIASAQGHAVDTREKLAIVGAGVSAYALRRVSRLAHEHVRLKAAVTDARARLRGLEAEWVSEHQKAADQFSRRVADLAAMRDEYLKLEESKNAARQKLDRERLAQQRRAFLQKHYIRTATLSGIGPGLTATLASFGFETAADLEGRRVYGVPGFGPARVATLMAWRQGLEARFRFDPTKPVDPAEVAALEQKFARRKVEIERTLLAGPSDLRRMLSSHSQVRQRLEERFAAQRREVSLSEANLAVGQ
ncbi:MAG: hypothetical protein IT355_03165 [Gemmatimonadaceae bacterium]|nr:hypothetical protein [Gemmatimonadaceae bacterium]